MDARERPGSASAYDRPDISKTWRRKDGSLLRPPEPETYKISLTRAQSQALKALAKAEGVKPFELASRAVVEFIRSRRPASYPLRAPPGPPMTLASMRQNGVRMVTATCEVGGRQADVNVDNLPETTTVPEAGQRLRCSRCGAKTISTRPAWRTSPRQGVPDFRPSERPPLS